MEVGQIVQAVCRDDGEHRAYCQIAANRNARLQPIVVNIIISSDSLNNKLTYKRNLQALHA